MEQRSEDTTGCEVAWSAGCITVSGEIDFANATVIGRQLRDLLAPGSVVVDCRAVTFLDVAGLRMLADLGAAAVDAGTAVHLRCSPALTQTMNLCGLREVHGLVLDRDDHDRPESPR